MLEVANLDAFYGRAQILHGVGFSVSSGEAVALLGRNGAGKTTTLKAIMRLMSTRGSIRFEGHEIAKTPTHQVARRGLGWAPEERRIFRDLTVLENLEVGRQPPRLDAPAWSVEALFALFPNLAERRRNLGSQLSGGEQQMLTIARMLMGNPKLILLDEPSEGIAPVIVEQMAVAIRKVQTEGLTVLVSEQNLHFARAIATRALILEGGAMKYDGSFAELDARADIRDAYLAV